MKKITKVLSVMMILAMLLSMTGIIASAADTGSIKLTNPAKDINYSLYKILDLATYDKSLGAYLYTVESNWAGFFTGTAAGLTYMEKITINNVEYVQWKAATTDDVVQAFAKAALAYAKDNSITNVGTYKGTGAETDGYTFSNLDLGYYLLDSSLGALCSLTTTDPDVTITEKNDTHTIDKVVKEDSTDSWGKAATYQIGDVVPFKVTITAKKGAESLVMHDIMEAGLTLNQSSFKITVSGVEMDSANYTITHAPTEHNGKNCTFHIAFAKTYLDSISANTEIVVEYSAVMNANAELHENTNDNTSWLTAGDDFFTEETTVKVSTFMFDLVKTNASKKLLANAKFEIYDAATGGNKISLVKVNDTTYRVATADEKAAEGFVSAEILTIANNPIRIQGLDGDTSTTYYLHETEAPAGYNLLDARVPVKLMTTDADPVATNLLATMDTATPEMYVSGGVNVINNTGSKLPETGGMGTTMFIVLGSFTALVFAVVLVARKKTAGYR